MKESRIEKYLKTEVTRTGGLSRKYVSPGVIGVADRLVFYQYPVFYLVELKATGKKARTTQVREGKRMKKLGYRYIVIDSLDGVDKFIKRATRRVAKLNRV